MERWERKRDATRASLFRSVLGRSSQTHPCQSVWAFLLSTNHPQIMLR